MRLIKSLVALCFVAMGVLLAALNTQAVHVDLWFRSFDARLGLVLICVLLAGVLLGGLALTIGVVWPMRRRLRGPSQTSTAAPNPSGSERA